MNKKIFISTGEVSGDIYGGELSKRLLELEPKIKLFGFGSECMKKNGVTILKDLSYYSGVGLTENINAVIPSINAFQLAKNFFIEQKPDLVILIDNQGFNLKLAQLAKKMNIKTAYYIGPQEWIWGIGNNSKKIIKNVDCLFAIFQKEYEFYKNKTDKVKYVGHPLLEIIKRENKEEVKKEMGFYKAKKVIGIMPGSRKSEIKSLLPIFLKTKDYLKEKYPEYEFVLIINEIWKQYIKDNFKTKEVKIFTGNSTYYMQGCDALVSASGTVTLESAILDIPIIANYKLSQLSYNIARMLIKLDFFTLPNIVLGKKVIPEFIQEQVNVENISNSILEILNNKQKKQELLENYSFIRKNLEPYEGIKKTVLSIKSMLN